MTSESQVAADVALWSTARRKAKQVLAIGGLVVGIAVPLVTVPALMISDTYSSGSARYSAVALVTGLLLAPGIVFAVRLGWKNNKESDDLVEELAERLVSALRSANQETAERELQARQQQFERRVANALEMADGEGDVLDVVARAFTVTAPDSSSELLLADHSHAHLVRMATASPSGESPGCSVDSPDNCPAARRAQTQHFTASEELDACPRLRGRANGPSSAICVPVSVMGRTVGVIHATGQVHIPFSDDQVSNFETLASLTGARIGLMRVMAETQLQASTDNLTGLLNRRSFEQQFGLRRGEADSMCLAMADFDHFKKLNDTYGHDSGDRALRLFAQTAKDALRNNDLVGRHGGEEFVFALTNCTTEHAGKVLDALRARLDAAITVAGLPRFTISFGVVQAQRQESLPSLITRADLALFEAKRSGRNRTVIHQAEATLPVQALSAP